MDGTRALWFIFVMFCIVGIGVASFGTTAKGNTISDEDLKILESCSKEVSDGVKAQLLQLETLPKEMRAERTAEIGGTYSTFYKYCVAWYRTNKDSVTAVPADLVMGLFIADSAIASVQQRHLTGRLEIR